MERSYDVMIVGGGPAGYTAALYCARSGLKTVVLEKLSAGGQIALTEWVDNYPGFDEGIDGFSLGQKMQAGAERFGAVTELAEVQALELTGSIKRAVTDQGVFEAKVVMLATGATPRPLGVAGEEQWLGRGIHYCAACDGMFYRGKTVAVVGGGNTAAADALLLSRVAKEVHVIHRRDTLRATKVYHQPLMEAENVIFHWDSQVESLLTGDTFQGVRLRNKKTGEVSDLSCDGVFVSIGRQPATELVAGQVELDQAGYVVADETTRTNLPGVFAIGDVRTKALRQVVTAAADGAVASYYADEYLAEGY